MHQLSPLAQLRRVAQAAADDGPLTDDDGVPDPEMPTTDLFDLVSFAMPCCARGWAEHRRARLGGVCLMTSVVAAATSRG